MAFVGQRFSPEVLSFIHSLPQVPLGRRVLLIIYEILLAIAIAFGVVFLVLLPVRMWGWPPVLSSQIGIGLALLVYFSWCWSNQRQTLPMKTWGVRLYALSGGQVSMLQASVRCVVYWTPLLVLALLHTVIVMPMYSQASSVVRCVWVASALLFPWIWGFFHPTGLPLHDMLSGTCLVRDSEISKRKGCC